MNRSTIIKIIDVLAFVGFLFLASTGILLHHFLPPGSGRSAEIWGLNRHEWGDIHFWIATLFFVLLSAHLNAGVKKTGISIAHRHSDVYVSICL